MKFVSMLLVVVVLSSLGVAVGYSQFGQVAIEGFGVVMSAVLSASLVLLYYKQAKTLGEQRDLNEEQTDILSDQTGIMSDQVEIQDSQKFIQEVGQIPQIEIEHFEFSGDDSELILTNVASGPATCIEFYVELEFEGCDWFDPEPMPTELSRKRDGKRKGSALPAIGDDEFTVSAKVANKSNRTNDDGGMSFRSAMTDLIEAPDVDEVQLDLYLRVSSILEETNPQRIGKPLVVELDHCDAPYTLEEIGEQAVPR